MGYLIAGYVVTAAVLGAYVWSLRARARRARAQAEAVAARRDGRPATRSAAAADG
jgi:hypothetical protein